MTRRVRLYLVGSLVLVSLAGCGRGFFQTAEREPWRREAEMSCLKSGLVKESAALVRVDPISGPGACGADFPLKVAELGEQISSVGFADDLRPPAGIASSSQPRWPIRQPADGGYAQPAAGAPYGNGGTSYRDNGYGAAPQTAPYTTAPASNPVSLNAPGVAVPDDEDRLGSDPGPDDDRGAPRSSIQTRPAQNFGMPSQPPLPRLGPSRGDPVGAIGPVSVKPTATLACPIVSALDSWIVNTVQPAAMRWFGARVVEIKQISAYSCRGMNGNPRAHISEHAFGNALDVAGFTLADGRRISVKDGWRGVPEEQGFLRDVQGGACQIFNTVLAPGSNVYHYDHIHVDLMRRSSGRVICQPAAVSGEVVASRAGGRAYANDSGITGSISRGVKRIFSRAPLSKDDEATIEDESRVTYGR